MKPLSRLLICATVLGVFALPSRAVMIGFYPGLDKLIQEADTIAIVRVEPSPSSGTSMVDGWVNSDCYVYQTLKGDLKANQNAQIMLNEAVGVKSNFDGSGLAPMSTHLVFLTRSIPVNGASYSIVCSEGADIPLSPLGNEKKPEGKTLKAQIQTLIRRYKLYRAEQAKKEDVVLNKALAD